MNRVQVRLKCHHNVRMPVGIDKSLDVYCRFDGYQPIDTIYAQEWHMWCADCNYGKWVGQSQPQLARVVDSHHKHRPTHTIYTAYDTVTANGRGTARDDKNIRPARGIDKRTKREDTVSCHQDAADLLPPF